MQARATMERTELFSKNEKKESNVLGSVNHDTAVSEQESSENSSERFFDKVENTDLLSFDLKKNVRLT